MDFLEGALLGSLWCDSDYENERHRGVTLIFSLLFWVVGVHLTIKANRGTLTSVVAMPILWLVILIVFMIVSPLLNFLYYDQEFPLRATILLFQLVKYISVFMFLYSLIVPKLILPKDDNLQEAAMQSLNRFAEIFFDNSGLSSSASGLVTTVILLLFATLVAIGVVVIVIVFLPPVLMKIIKFCNAASISFFCAAQSGRHIDKHPFKMLTRPNRRKETRCSDQKLEVQI